MVRWYYNERQPHFAHVALETGSACRIRLSTRPAGRMGDPKMGAITLENQSSYRGSGSARPFYRGEGSGSSSPSSIALATACNRLHALKRCISLAT